MQVQQQPDAVSARQGHVDSQRIWRLPVLKDGKVFLRSEEENNPGFTVDLLLDGSASRLHCQETIAAQGYILTRSLAACGIPVRVSSFCSLRGYTVVRILKDFSEKKRGKKKFSITLLPAGIGTDWRCAWQEATGYRSGGSASADPADRCSPDDSRKFSPPARYRSAAATMARQACRTPPRRFVLCGSRRPGRCRLYGRERQRPRCTDDLWAGSGPYPTDGPACHRCRKTHSGGDSGTVRVSMCKYIVKVIIFPAADIKRRNCNRSFSFQPVEKV